MGLYYLRHFFLFRSLLRKHILCGTLVEAILNNNCFYFEFASKWPPAKAAESVTCRNTYITLIDCVHVLFF